MCSLDVKLTLFRSYCSSFYTSQLWVNYTKKTMHKLYTAYHNVLKMFIGVSKCEHTRPICANLNVQYCPALIRNFIYKFMSRLIASENIYMSRHSAILVVSIDLVYGNTGGICYTQMV